MSDIGVLRTGYLEDSTWGAFSPQLTLTLGSHTHLSGSLYHILLLEVSKSILLFAQPLVAEPCRWGGDEKVIQSWSPSSLILSEVYVQFPCQGCALVVSEFTLEKSVCAGCTAVPIRWLSCCHTELLRRAEVGLCDVV